VTGTVTEVNQSLGASPERVNTSPYVDGWLVRVRDVAEGGVDLVDEAAYLARAEE
jgi:glycine cleavage system H protein